MSGMKYPIVIAVILASLLVWGCERTSRKLVGGYILDRFAENGKYYLLDPNDKDSGGGVFDGIVNKIGWNQDWIVANISKLSSGDADGWYALNLKTKQITGPYQEVDLKTNTLFSKIKYYNSSDVVSGSAN